MFKKKNLILSLSDKMYIRKGKLMTSIGIVASNIEIFLYQTISGDGTDFGVIELFFKIKKIRI